jgi:ankyrin repeat protein
MGFTVGHAAAAAGQLACLQALASLGAGALLSGSSAEDAMGFPPAYYAAAEGHEACLRFLLSLPSDADRSQLLAFTASRWDQPGCLRVLAELGLSAAFSVVADDAGLSRKNPCRCDWCKSVNGVGLSPAHAAVQAVTGGSPSCLNVLAEFGGDVALCSEEGARPVHDAVDNGNLELLEALAALPTRTGGPASLMAASMNGGHNDVGWTPAHHAAIAGNVDCLQLLHMLLPPIIEPIMERLRPLQDLSVSGTADMVAELDAQQSLSVRDKDGQTPAHILCHRDHGRSSLLLSLASPEKTLSCLRFLAGVRGLEPLLEDLREQPTKLRQQ